MTNIKLSNPFRVHLLRGTRGCIPLFYMISGFSIPIDMLKVTRRGSDKRID